MYQILTPDFVFEDYRGKLVQLVHSGYTQINIVTTNRGVIRGNHYHRFCTEAFYIVAGSVDVVLSRNDQEVARHFGDGDFFEIAPLTVHRMSYPEDCIMVALYDRPVETDCGKDIFIVEGGV